MLIICIYLFMYFFIFCGWYDGSKTFMTVLRRQASSLVYCLTFQLFRVKAIWKTIIVLAKILRHFLSAFSKYKFHLKILWIFNKCLISLTWSTLLNWAVKSSKVCIYRLQNNECNGCPMQTYMTHCGQIWPF